MRRVGIAHDAEDLVALIEEKLGQIRAVLSRDTGDEGPLGHSLSLLSACDRRLTARFTTPSTSLLTLGVLRT